MRLGWAQLWSVVDSDGEVGFRGGLTGHWCGFRRRLQLVMESPAATKCAVGEVRAGWIEAEEFSKDDLELVVGECWFHVRSCLCGAVGGRGQKRLGWAS